MLDPSDAAIDQKRDMRESLEGRMRLTLLFTEGIIPIRMSLSQRYPNQMLVST